MRTGTVSYKLEDLKKGVIIPIGFVGENDFTKVFFDAEEIYKKFPNASVSMKVQPPKGGIYPATVTRDGNTVIWQVKEADVANRGGGELQLTFTDGETKIKTYIARTDVKRSLAGNGPAPDPVQDWVDNAEEVLDDLAAMDNIAKTALEGDIGKALSPKTVENGVVTEWQFVEPGAGTDDYADLDNKPSIAGVTLSGNKTLEDLGIASDDDLDNLAAEVSDVKTAIDGIEDDVSTLNTVCGIGSSTQIIMPTGYKSANYSNAAGTLKFKWENNKLTLKKANGSAGEITTSNASLTIDDTLTYEVVSGSNDEIVFDYDNDSEEDDDAFIGLRFCHKNNLSSYVSARAYIPSGTGTKSIKLTKIAEDYEVNLSDYKYLVIRSIKTETAAGATVYINGYKKTIASENISDRVTALEGTATELAGEIEDLNVGVNLYKNRYEDLGYLNTSTGELNLYSADYVEKTSDFIDVVTGDRIYIQTWVSATPKVRIGFFDNLKAFISGSQMPDSTATILPDGTYYLDGYFDVPNNAKFIKVSYASYGITGKIKVTKNGILSDWSPAPIDVGSHVFNIADNYNLIGVAHMGKKNLAPENTAPSFIAAAQNGYQFVETDVRFTSDGVPVLIHDATINRVARNSDGTQLSTDVYIKDITYAEALEYDFGYAFNQSFAGTKIMRFVDFIILCRNIGLYPFIEIKNDDNLFTEAQIHTLVDIVDTYRMNEKTTWQSYSLKSLVWIKKYRPESRLMMSASPVTIKRILEVEYLRTAFNETAISADETAENISLIKPHKITMHTFATESEYDDIDPYITSVVSDGTNYETYVRNRELNA